MIHISCTVEKSFTNRNKFEIEFLKWLTPRRRFFSYRWPFNLHPERVQPCLGGKLMLEVSGEISSCMQHAANFHDSIRFVDGVEDDMVFDRQDAVLML